MQRAGQRICFPKPGTPSVASPASRGHRAGARGTSPYWARFSQVIRLSSLVSLPPRARQGCQQEKRTHVPQPHAAEQAYGVTGPAAPWTVVSGGGAPGTSPCCPHLYLLGSHHASSVSHCVRTFLSLLPCLSGSLQNSQSDPCRAAENPGTSYSSVSPHVHDVQNGLNTRVVTQQTPNPSCLPGRGLALGGPAMKELAEGPVL